MEVYESERFFPFVGWQEPKGQLDEFFTGRFNDVRGAGSTSYFKDYPLPEGWRWDSQWEVDLGVEVDKAGWAYGTNWVTSWHGSSHHPIYKKNLNLTVSSLPANCLTVYTTSGASVKPQTRANTNERVTRGRHSVLNCVPGTL